MNLPEINVQTLIKYVLDVENCPWRKLAEIIPNYQIKYPNGREESLCVVRYQNWFLRHSKGPLQGHSWDCYGDDYQSPELALLALAASPPPPDCVKSKVWEAANKESK
jgi:hypothetical protein